MGCWSADRRGSRRWGTPLSRAASARRTGSARVIFWADLIAVDSGRIASRSTGLIEGVGKPYPPPSKLYHVGPPCRIYRCTVQRTADCNRRRQWPARGRGCTAQSRAPVRQQRRRSHQVRRFQRETGDPVAAPRSRDCFVASLLSMTATDGVIASPRVGAERRPRINSSKQSRFGHSVPIVAFAPVSRYGRRVSGRLRARWR